MAVTPLAPATFAPAAPVLAPVAAEPAVSVTPAAAATNSGASDSATSDQSDSQKLPLDKALDEINDQMKAWSTQLQFEIDPNVHQVVVSVVDAESGDVIRTIPSETVLKIAKMIVNMQGNGIKTSA
ncbi:flagellar protein FlaG [Achromobacter sp. ESBL13]|uniref:flagellar protein FlaG n=1 Tax=Achromobacter sp. ESBL13 TaxID=3077328 RepID=UPI002FCC141A